MVEGLALLDADLAPVASKSTTVPPQVKLDGFGNPRRPGSIS